MVKKLSFITIVILSVLIISSATCYVYEGDYGVIKRFGKVMVVHENPGLKWKLPFIDTKDTLPNKYLLFDPQPSEVLTKDKKSMSADTYTVWKITKPIKFLQTAGTVDGLLPKLEAAIYGSLKTTIGSIDQIDIIEARLDNSLNVKIKENAYVSLENYGIELKDVQIKTFDLPDSNRSAVFNRMISERNRMAATYRAEGKEEADKIKNTADMEKNIIISEANREKETLIAEGESEYMRLLSESFAGTERAQFYEFIRTLDALKVTMKGNKKIILSEDSLLVRTLMNPK